MSPTLALILVLVVVFLWCRISPTRENFTRTFANNADKSCYDTCAAGGTMSDDRCQLNCAIIHG